MQQSQVVVDGQTFQDTMRRDPIPDPIRPDPLAYGPIVISRSIINHDSDPVMRISSIIAA